MVQFNYPISNSLKLALALPAKLTPVQFIEKYVILPRVVSNDRPGAIRVDTWMIPILNDLGNKKVIQRILQSCTQIGKTTLLTLLVMWALFYKERNCLIVFPTQLDATRFFRRNILGVIKASPHFRKYLGEKTDISKVELVLRNGVTIRAAWAGSAASLASSPASVVIMDEVDKMKVLVGKESDPISLAEARMGMALKTGALMFCASTPTDQFGWIAKLNGKSRLNQWTFACPKCQVVHPVDFYNLTWPGHKDARVSDLEADPSQIKWKCPNSECKHLLQESEFRIHVRKGSWQLVENQEIESKSHARIGYKLNGIMSEHKSWLYIVSKFLTQENGIEFKNSVLGEVFEERAQVYQSEWLENAVDQSLDYKLYECPDDTLDIVAGIDVRGDIEKNKDHYYHCIVTAVQPRDRFTVIGAEYFESSEDLIRFLQRTYKTASSTADNMMTYGVSQAFIDSGYQPASIYKLCIQNPALKPVKGQPNSSNIVKASSPESTKNFDGSLRDAARQLILYNVNGHYFKDKIWNSVKQEPPLLRFVKGLTPEVFEHIEGEKKMLKVGKNGQVSWQWVQRWPGKGKGKSENHYLDALAYSLALAFVKYQNDLTNTGGDTGDTGSAEDFPGSPSTN